MNKEELGEEFMKYLCKECREVGDSITEQLALQFFLKRTESEREISDETISYLESLGYFTRIEKFPVNLFQLTQAGYDHIFNPNKQGA